MIGSSTSDISGDKTESNRGGSDYWIVKIQEADFFVEDITIINADTDVDIVNFKEDATINLLELNNPRLTVRVNTIPTKIDSLKLELSGPVTYTQVERYYPYALFGDEPKTDSKGRDYIGLRLKPGQYNLKRHLC